MLSWTQLNPTVKISDTKKKFYKKYLHKAIVYMPGGRLIYDTSNKTWEERLQDRIQQLDYHYDIRSNSVRVGNSWQATRTHWFYKFSRLLKEEGRPDQFQYWHSTKTQFKDSIYVRVEEPNLSIYSNDLNLLYQLVSDNYPERLTEIVTPKNDAIANRLDQGEILVKTITNYDYRITLKDTRIDVEKKHQLLDYLYNLGEEVRLTKSLIKNLGNNFSWFPSGYFYAKDEKIVMFIQLIAPNLISEINKIAIADQ